jgi:hypothetical protein
MASVQSAAFYQQWRFNLFLRMFCEDSIFLYESPQPSRSSDIRCTEHQYAQTFCSRAAMLRTKHFMFPLIPCGSRGPPKAALLFQNISRKSPYPKRAVQATVAINPTAKPARGQMRPNSEIGRGNDETGETITSASTDMPKLPFLWLSHA